MAEGGVLPWKRQSTRRVAAAPDYARLLQPLPEPPAGLQWIQTQVAVDGEGSSSSSSSPTTTTPPSRTEWRLVATTPTVQATVVVEEDEDGQSWAAATPPSSAVVLLRPEDALPAATTTHPVTATATLDTEDLPLVSVAAAAALPRATRVTGSPVSSHTGSNNISSQDGKAGGHADDDNDKEDPHGVLGIDYTRHVVLPTDTWAGLCLAYRISARDLRRANGLYSHNDSLRLAPETLVVPLTARARKCGVARQDTNSPAFQTAAVRARCPHLSRMEVQCYLQTNDWNLEAALEEALADAAWEEQERVRQQQQEAAAVANATTNDTTRLVQPSGGPRMESSERDCVAGALSAVRTWCCPKRSSLLELTEA